MRKRKYIQTKKRIPYNPNNRICPGKVYSRPVVPCDSQSAPDANPEFEFVHAGLSIEPPGQTVIEAASVGVRMACNQDKLSFYWAPRQSISWYPVSGK